MSYDEHYSQFTPEMVKTWEGWVKDNPDVKWNYNKISELLPFIKKILPRVGKNQSLFGFSIISLLGDLDELGLIVLYGLEPLHDADILDQREVQAIVNWFTDSTPLWDNHSKGVYSQPKDFNKKFMIDGVNYELRTDNYRNYRDLNLVIKNQKT